MAIKPCPKCGESISDQSKKCVYCGEKVYTCPECGEFILASNECCPKCGNPISEEATAEKVVEAPKQPEQKIDSKELLTEWKNSSKFAKFSFDVWKPLYQSLTFTFIGGLATVFIIALVSFAIASLKGSSSAFAVLNNSGNWIIVLGYLFSILASVNILFDFLKKNHFINFIKRKGLDFYLVAAPAINEITIDEFLNPKKIKLSAWGYWFACPSYYVAECSFLASKEDLLKSEKSFTVASIIKYILLLPLDLIAVRNFIVLGAEYIDTQNDANLLTVLFATLGTVLIISIISNAISKIHDTSVKNSKQIWALQNFAKGENSK